MISFAAAAVLSSFVRSPFDRIKAPIPPENYSVNGPGGRNQRRWKISFRAMKPNLGLAPITCVGISFPISGIKKMGKYPEKEDFPGILS
jgi:hypothetical protein